MSAQTSFVQPLDALRRDLLAARALNDPPTPWRVLALSYPGVPAGTLCAIAKGREPKSPAIRAALGLPVLIPAPACVCGEVHVRRGRCPNAPKPQPPAWVTAAADLLAARERLTPPRGACLRPRRQGGDVVKLAIAGRFVMLYAVGYKSNGLGSRLQRLPRPDPTGISGEAEMCISHFGVQRDSHCGGRADFCF